MSKVLKILSATVCALFVLSIGLGVFAAGYEVLMEPSIESIDGKLDDADSRGIFGDTRCYPTPFNKGYSVVHNNVLIEPGYEATYYDKSAYVVDMYGNKVDVGEYDSLGVYPFTSSYLPDGYNTPFDIEDGVNALGYITTYKNGKIGLIDVNGNVVIPCEYDSLFDGVYEQYNIDSGSSYFKNDGMYEGKYFFPSYSFFQYEYVHYYYNGLAVVAENESENAKVGIVDKNDNIVVPFIYEQITPCYDKVCWALKDGKWGIILVDNKPITVKVDNEEVTFDQSPLIINGRTLAPLRAVFEKLGATVEWDDATKTVTSTKGDTVITMTVGKNEMYKNGEMFPLDVEAQIVGSRTLVPVRAIAEAFNCDVTWNADENAVYIAK